MIVLQSLRSAVFFTAVYIGISDTMFLTFEDGIHTHLFIHPYTSPQYRQSPILP